MYNRGKEEWYEELWQRSRPSLVHLSCMGYPHALKKEYVPRLKGLRFCVSPPNFVGWKLLTERPEILAWQLETLEIGVVFEASARIPCILEFPQMVCSSKPPQLKELILGRCKLDLTSPIFSHLTLFSTDMGHTVSEWLAILKNMPLLRSLSLRGDIPLDSVNGLCSIDLPRLHHFKLYADMAAASAIIAHVHMPLSCALDLSFGLCEPGLALDDLLHILCRYIGHRQAVDKMQGLRILATSRRVCIESKDANHTISQDRFPDIRIHFITDLFSESVFLQVMTSLDSAQYTTSLALQFPFADTVPIIIPSLHKLKAVTNILLGKSGAVARIMPYLASLSSDTDAIFPSLEIITLNPVDFTPADYNNLVELVQERHACPFTNSIKQIRLIWTLILTLSATPFQIETLERLGVQLEFLQQDMDRYIFQSMTLVWTNDTAKLVLSTP